MSPTGFVFFMSLATIVVLFYHSVAKKGFKTVILSHFWLFTFFYFLTYFLSQYFLFLDRELIVILSSRPSDFYITMSMLIALVLWIFSYLGYIVKPNIRFKKRMNKISPVKLAIFALFSIFIFIYLSSHLVSDRILENRILDVFKYSNGSGLKVILLNFYTFTFYYYLTYYYTNSHNRLPDKVLHISLFATIAIIMIFSSFLFGTRRTFAMLFVGIMYIYIITSSKQQKVLVSILFIGILSTPFLAVILQIVRFWNPYVSIDVLSQAVILFSQITVSTFEGHWLALYLQKTDLADIIIGKNLLEPFGSIISLIPRIFWENKPYDLGVIEIQKYLVPSSFDEHGMPTITLPSTIAVEALYTGGLVVGALYMFFVGILLRLLSYVSQASNIVVIFVSIYFYLNIFNFVRGGTSSVFTVVVPILILTLLLEKQKKQLSN